VTVANRRPKTKTPSDKKRTSGEVEAVRIRLLGGFQVSVGARTIEEGAWRLRKAASLVKLLALAPEHRLHREQAMDLLWPDLGKKAASNNLRQALHAARGILNPTAGSRYLASEDESLVLCPEGNLWVDVDAFEEAAVSARRSRDPATYRAALDLYGGDLLPEDRYEEWAEGRREELRQLYLGLLIELAGLHEERDEPGLAIETLRKAMAKEPTLEEAHVALMRLHALSGRPEQALAQYERLRDALFRELGTEPGQTTRRLRDEIAAGKLPPDQPAAPPPPEQPPDASKHNLPTPRTNFVGREREMVEVKRTLAMTGILTLTGTGGSGKTRLALEAARDLLGVYPDGVWLVELAPLSEGALVAQELAATLGVREQPGLPLLDTLLNALRDKEMLLVLDNCEHLIDAAARLAETLLDSCPRMQVLATSREPLGVRGELSWLVPSLSAPGAQQSPTVEELESYESARLFADRASNRNPGFELTPENATSVAQVCAMLEGIPLAIELAAARVGMLSAEQISERLGHSLKLLTGGNRTADHRHQTLRAALDWSYELLSEPEQVLFRRLSVFAGGFTLEAAESVGAGGGIEEEDVLELLSMLVDKSLVVAEESWESGARYRLWEPLRQYAQERLEDSGESEVVQRGHAAYFLALAEAAETELKGAPQGEWLERLEAEHDNLRAALSWSLDREEAELGLRLAAALRWFWYARGYLSEGRRWLEGSLSLSDAGATQAQAWALDGAGWISLFQGEFDAAKMFLEEALAMFRELEDREGIASTLANLGFVAMMGQRNDIPVPALLEEARELRPTLRDHRTVAYLLLLEGVVTIGRGELAFAMELHEESLALLREVRDVQGVGGCLFNMGLIETARADYSRATELHREALSVAREAGDKNIVQLAFFGLANAAARRGQLARAARLWGASEAVREVFDMQLSPMTSSFAGYENNLSTVRSQLGGTAFEEAWTDGKAMVLQQAVEYALSKEEPAPPTVPAPEEEPLAGEPTGKLTPREQEVALLLARGLTNRQVSTRLGISERTAANHVASILHKLGLHSRAQVATWATEHQLLTTPHPD
jgi:predicted ATPase/DNA-binding SARP family transcriptional activator/DNA-binding CsgD family transcriptional regulator